MAYQKQLEQLNEKYQELRMQNDILVKLVRTLEKENNQAPMPIIALTANATHDDRLLCEQVGMDDVVTKPFKRMDLSDCLQQWLPQEKVNI